MMKKLKKGYALVLVLLCFLSTASFAKASTINNDIPISPYYNYISTVNATLGISSSGKATCQALVKTYGAYNIELTMTLQQSANRTTWNDVNTWNAAGTRNASVSKAYYVSSGNYYRVTVVANIYDSNHNLLESVPNTSDLTYY